MGNGAIQKKHRYQEPFRIDVTPKSSARDACGSIQSMHEGGLVKPTPPPVVLAAPHQRKAGVKSRKHPTSIKQTILDDRLAEILDPDRLQRQRTEQRISPQRARSKPCHTCNDIEQMFPHLIDADEMASTNIQKAHAELVGTINEDLAKRRCTFRALCLQWHASRHNGKQSARWAEQVYQHLLAQRTWYLAPDAMPVNLAADMAAARNSLSHTYGK